MAPCDLCGAGTMRILRRFAQDPEAACWIHLGSCRACHSLALVPQPSDPLLRRQYDRYFHRRTESLPGVKVEYFHWFLEQVGGKLADTRVLELGPGEGDLIRAINQVAPSAHVTAVEPLWSESAPKDLQVEAIAQPVEHFLRHYRGARFDVVFMCDLLEHLRDPRAAVKHLAQHLLNPGGRLVATMPSGDATSRWLMGPLWPQYKIEHLHYVSRAALELLTAEADLRLVTLRPHRKRLPIGYLLNVGSAFGPRLLQGAVQMVRSVVPRSLHGIPITAGYGEWLWIAERPV